MRMKWDRRENKDIQMCQAHIYALYLGRRGQRKKEDKEGYTERTV